MRTTPLLDSTFLRELDFERNRTTYARITSLTLEGYPVDRIEGVVTAGSINLDGDSAVRRVCDLTLTTGKFNINNVYWGLSTRVKIEIGIQNNLLKYKDIYDDIIWFNQGVYVLTDFSTSAQVNNYTISLTGKDKMCLLNGDVSGTFNAETYLDSERVEQEDGSWVDEKRPIYYIIREMIHYYAHESFHNIIIKDIDTLSLRALKNVKTTFYLIQSLDDEHYEDIYWLDKFSIPNLQHEYVYADQPLKKVTFNNLPEDFVLAYLVDEDDIGLIKPVQTIGNPTIILDENNKCYIVINIEYGEDIGYDLTETYYPDELIAGIGETVTSILDKIVETFGAFEYFYNLDGQFVFQAKQTYVNTAWNNIIKIENEKYIAPAMVASQVVYSFDSNELTTAYQNAPSLGEIKNDFTVWGKKKNASGIELPIHMRYAIDIKPEFYWSYNGIGYVSEDYYNEIITKEYDYEIQSHSDYLKDIISALKTDYEKQRISLIRAGATSLQLDEVYKAYSQKLDYYKSELQNESYEEQFDIVILNNEKYQIVDWREIIYQMAKDYQRHNHDDDFEVMIQKNNNKTFTKLTDHGPEPINFRPYERGRTGYEQYYHDIEGFWRLLYAPKEYLDEYNKDQSKYPAYTVNIEDFYRTTMSITGKETIQNYIGPWNKNITLDPPSLLFWFDFFDANDLGLGQFSVPAIGDRPKEESNDSIRSLVYKDIPDVVFIEESLYRQYEEDNRLLDGYSYIVFISKDKYEQYKAEGLLSENCVYMQYSEEKNYIQQCIEDGNIRLSDRTVTAQESIDELLYNYAYCNETVTITSVPIYYLEPNTIISAEDHERRVNGYYIISKISLPLDYKGTMQITAVKVPERVY